MEKKENKKKTLRLRLKSFITYFNLPLMVIGFTLAGLVLGVGIFIMLYGFVQNKTQNANDIKLYDLAKTTVTLLGVVTVGAAAAVQYRKQAYTEKSYKLDSEEAERERDAVYISTLTKAIEHLGDDSSAICKGGLYELKRLAEDSKRDRDSIVRIIEELIREKKKRGKDEEKKVAQYVLCSLIECFSRDIKFSGMYFEDMDLCKANLIKADFKGVRISKANFNGADITEANFSGVTLVEADFSSATLTGAIFCNANLRGSDFKNATLNKANFRGADLIDAKYLTTEQLAEAYFDEHTQLDDDIKQRLIEMGMYPNQLDDIMGQLIATSDKNNK